MPSSSLERFSIVVDSNEYSHGKAWIFPGYNIHVQSLLKFGCDYAIRGQVGTIGVERKSYDDYVRCIGVDWERFQKQLAKLQTNRHYAVIVEGNIDDPITRRSLMIPESVITQTAKVVALGVPIVFAGSRLKAAVLCAKFFKAALKRVQDGV